MKSKRLRRIGLELLLPVLLFVLIDKLAPVDTSIAFAPVVMARDSSVLHTYLAEDGQWRMNAAPNEITPELRKAIVFKEDKYFYLHFGVNPVAVCRALISNVFRHRRVSGASTITMQVARMLDPKRRTYGNKLVEMFRATQLELHYSKEQILQLYLNLVPYGSNIQGVKAAAVLYLNKTPDHLSLAEITALSIIPNRPNSLVPGRHNERIVAERNRWLRRFAKAGLFDDKTIADALKEPFNAFRHNAPAGAPQFARRVRAMYPLSGELVTSLDAGIQSVSETITANYSNQLKLHNIHNASVIVLDNKTREVLAYVGSSDFNDSAHFGQVDGVYALRSPGSTLKPLLYGLGFDKGLITPMSAIADVPVNIKGYSPENYNREFRGNVTIEYALCHSLNIPAVKMLEQVGLPDFVKRLELSGFRSIAERSSDIGLSVILGGCSVRLEELAMAYAAIANGGYYSVPHYLTAAPDGSHMMAVNATDTSTRKILSAPACFMLTHILRGLHRPDLPNSYATAQQIPRIAWKTGTSYGRKDAWSIGYNKDYTIGVWVGNFSAEGVQELSGTATATPLLFQLFNAIDHNAATDVEEPPAGVSFRLVCAETGKLPDEFCENQVMDFYIPGVSGAGKCDHMKQVWTTADGRYSYCTTCRPATGYKTVLLPNIPADLAAYYDGAKVPYAQTPPHSPECTRMFPGGAPTITSLTNGMTYLVENAEQQKFLLSCAAGNDVRKVYWYINDRFYASTDVHEKVFFSANAPLLKISCADDKGRNTNIHIKVKFI